LFSEEYAGKRALVLDQELPGLEETAVKDYYHLVILETDLALTSVPVPDFLLWQESSPYRGGVLTFPDLFTLDQTSLVTNYETIQEMVKIHLDVGGVNVNYLPSDEASSSTPNIERKTESGLSISDPGVHFALITGCTEVQYTGTSPNATTVTKDDIVAFTEEQDRFFPKNLVRIDRPTVLNDYF